MAEQRVAVLRSSTELGRETRLLTFALAPDAEFPYVAGKYIIVDTGLLLADGKIRKRAYTLVSFDAEAKVFEIAVRHVGVATEFLHALTPGQELRFSGPWGKYLPHEPDVAEKIWVVATDTGITAALGLLQDDELKSRPGSVELVWWLDSPDYFLPKGFVEEKIGTGLKSFEVIAARAIGDVERVVEGQRWMAERLERERPSRVYLSGDGLVVLPWMEMLIAAGVPGDRIHIETFFNHAKSKA